MDRPTTAEVARFFDKVRITKHCWLWEAYTLPNGYGQFKFRYSNVRAHRFSYELFVAPIELGKHILHRRECGNRNCVNPNHLYMGTNADNMRDRGVWGTPKTKLTKEDVSTIRRLYKRNVFGYSRLAKMFNVSITSIKRIIKRKNWKYLEGH